MPSSVGQSASWLGCACTANGRSASSSAMRGRMIFYFIIGPPCQNNEASDQRRSPHPDDAAVPAPEGAASGHPDVLPDGGFLRAVLRRRGKGRAAAGSHPDRARPVGGRAGAHGGRTGAFGGAVPRETGQAGRVGG